MSIHTFKTMMIMMMMTMIMVMISSLCACIEFSFDCPLSVYSACSVIRLYQLAVVGDYSFMFSKQSRLNHTLVSRAVYRKAIHPQL